MPVTSAMIANDIINRVATEVGLIAVADPFSSADENFIQMRTLLDIAGEELCLNYDWSFLVRETSIDTDIDNSGDYDLPADFLYITNQTCWERNNRVPVVLLTAQDWNYLEGRQFASDTIYAKFRIQKGKFTLYPQPAPGGLDIHYEYTSRNWVESGTQPGTYQSQVLTGSDKPLFDRTLISRYLKVKWLDAKGFDSTKAQDDFNQAYALLTGREKGGPTLYAGTSSRGGVPILNAYDNLPDTNYGR